jgi:hypothetical protein
VTMTTPAASSGDSPLAASLAADPFTALAVHYGMLLGVSDFQVLAANPRGKLQVHQAWLHGKGVVWGYPVGPGEHPTELKVGPGLATDGPGREMSSSVDLCLDVKAWLDEQKKAKRIEPDQDGDRSTFGARLVLRHEACLARPVPSISSTCGQPSNGVDYSRVIEMAHVELRPYDKVAGKWRPPQDDRGAAFPQLRALVRSGVWPSGAPAPSSWLDAFRAVAAAEGAAVGPPGLVPTPSERTKLFPEDEPGEIVLADLPSMALVKVGDAWRLDLGVVDLSTRRVHVPTWLIGELLAELLTGQVGGAPAADAGGPRVAAITSEDTTVTVAFDRVVVHGTVEPAIEVRSFASDAAAPAWSAPLAVVVAAATSAGPDPHTTVTVELPAAPSDTLTFRLVVRGTGPTPLVALVDGRPVPLAGWVGGPPGTGSEGHDVAEIIEQGAHQ